MGVLAAIVVGAGLGTIAITGYFHSQDPIYQCIDDPTEQPYQVSVPLAVTENSFPAIVPKRSGLRR